LDPLSLLRQENPSKEDLRGRERGVVVGSGQGSTEKIDGDIPDPRHGHGHDGGHCHGRWIPWRSAKRGLTGKRSGVGDGLRPIADGRLPGKGRQHEWRWAENAGAGMKGFTIFIPY
jgi:hypothetical protein